MTESKTKYLTLTGRAFWAKVYTPDEFRGASKWMLNLYLDTQEEWDKFKDAGIQKLIKVDGEKKARPLSDIDPKLLTSKTVSFPVTRNTSKMIKGKLVYFAPPTIYDKNGAVLVQYVNDKGSPVRSYEDPNARPRRVGDTILIGNGSLVSVRLSVYPTAMGPGNRLESITLLDLINYEPPAIPEDSKEVKGPEKEITNDELTSPPW